MIGIRLLQAVIGDEHAEDCSSDSSEGGDGGDRDLDVAQRGRDFPAHLLRGLGGIWLWRLLPVQVRVVLTGLDGIRLALGILSNLVPVARGVLARASRVVEIVVAREGRHGSRGSCRELGAVESAGVQAGLAHWIDARNSGLPAGNLRHGVEHLTRRLCCLVVANHGNTPVIGVEATHVGTLDGLVQAAVAALVNRAELIYEHVISDIAPA